MDVREKKQKQFNTEIQRDTYKMFGLENLERI